MCQSIFSLKRRIEQFIIQGVSELPKVQAWRIIGNSEYLQQLADIYYTWLLFYIQFSSNKLITKRIQ